MSSRSSSRSEGEILTSDSDKATRSQPSRNGTHVDRHTRPISSAPRSPARGLRRSRSRSRSPYRAPRGDKRRDDSHSRQTGRDDPRTFSVKYEDSHGDKHKRQTTSESYSRDRHYSRHGLGYDEESRGGHRSKRQRTRSRSRSRSPYKRSRLESSEIGNSTPKDGSAQREQSVSTKSKAPLDAHARNPFAKTSSSQNSRSVQSATPTSQSDPAEDTLGDSAVKDEATLIEERRKRREAIKNKYRGQAPPSLLVQALQIGKDLRSVPSSATATPAESRKSGKTTNRLERLSLTAQESPGPSSPQTPRDTSEPQSPADMSFGDDLGNRNDDLSPDNIDEPSAADYDPTFDMQEERARHDMRMFKEDELSTANADRPVLDRVEQTQDRGSSPTRLANTLDMFAEDDDDMFAEAPVQNAPAPKMAQALDVTMMDNWDDTEGYYITIQGELLENRYHVTQNLGRGMFSSVVRATDTTTNELVAIKIVRNNDTMRKAGIKEIDILRDIAANDPEDKKHVIRLHRSFEHKGHLCMVFENLSLNLREVLKKFGRDVGINLRAIRAYAQQLFLGLSLLRKCQYLHADLKPDNILVNENRNMLKICDLGSASSITENVPAPYLVSRFYRAPEIILGIPYDYGIDMWSVGATLFELFSGKILFTGRNNNAMLKSIMECRGKFPHKLLRKGTLSYQYFDDLLSFQSIEMDKLTGREVVRMIQVREKPVPGRDLRSRLVPKGRKMDEGESRELSQFVDLLERCLDLRPEKRITPVEALRHPFLMRK